MDTFTLPLQPVARRQNLRLQKSPIFSLSRVLAIFPFNGRQLFKNRYPTFFYGLLFLVAFVVIMSTYVRKTYASQQSNTNVLLYTGYICSNFILCVTFVVAPIMHQHSMASILEGKNRKSRHNHLYHLINADQYKQPIKIWIHCVEIKTVYLGGEIKTVR